MFQKNGRILNFLYVSIVGNVLEVNKLQLAMLNSLSISPKQLLPPFEFALIAHKRSEIHIVYMEQKSAHQLSSHANDEKRYRAKERQNNNPNTFLPFAESVYITYFFILETRGRQRYVHCSWHSVSVRNNKEIFCNEI